MKFSALAGLLLVGCLLAPDTVSAQADDVTWLRVFLRDGAALISYGEFARVGDRVIFSMPTGASAVSLRLVNIAADRVDWDRTNRYAESVRATRYMSTRAEADFAALSNDVARTLNDVASAPDAEKRLALVEQARKTLADWPRDHFMYRAAEVRQMLSMLDEAIADLRVAAGASRFDIALTAFSGEAAVLEPAMPPPTPRDAIEQTLLAARLSETAADREALLEAAVVELDRGAGGAPADWVAAMRADTAAALTAERQTDRAYADLSRRVLARLRQRARAADIRGMEALVVAVQRHDAALGGRRPETIDAIVAAIAEKLDAARQLQLARDRWALRASEYRRYRAAIAAPVDLFQLWARIRPALEDIKTLAGSPPATLALVRRVVSQIGRRAAAIAPPDELRAAHGLLVSAVQMAGSAADIRREATMSASMARAWDASSAAAGALLLASRARSEIQSILRPPPLR